MFKKLLQMGFWRIAGIGAGALGAIWAARMLGPEKLGISGMVNAYGMQATLFVTLGLNALLIREFKKAQGDLDLQDRIISEVTSYRIVAALVLSLIWLVISLAVGLPSDWFLATSMGILTLIAGALTTDWLLQAQENQVVQQRLVAIGGFLSAVLMFAFVRQGSPAGSDLVVAFVVAMVVRTLTWNASVTGRHRFAFSLAKLKDGVPRLWRGRWLFLSSLLIYCYVRLEVPLVGWMRSVEEVGQYRSAQQLLGGVQPVLALVPALLYPRMIEWGKVGLPHLWKKQIQIAALLAALAVPAIAVTFLIVPAVYPYIFGVEFQEAAVPACFLIVAKIMVVLNGVFGWGLWSLEKDLTMLLIMSVVAVVSISLNVILIPRFGILGASVVNAFSEFVMLVGCFVFQYRNCHAKKV